MDNKGSGTNLAFWLPGSAVILSLVVSMFALNREPFLEPRPIGAQFQAQLPIEARLWQDPFDAVERYRKKLTDSKNPDAEHVCSPDLSPLAGEKPAPDIMVALVEGGPYADEVERRRRIRYALLAGFKNSHRVPDQEQYIHCLRLAANLSLDAPQQAAFVDAPYEVFVSNPFDPPTALEGAPPPPDRTIVFWVKQDALDSTPLQSLETLRETLKNKMALACAPKPCSEPPDTVVLKVIGPSTSTVLRDMFQDQDIGKATPNVEIYSPLATADNETLDRGYPKLSPPLANRQPMKLLRTVSDDGTMTQLMLEELKLRRVDPATGVRCSEDKLRRIGSPCTRDLRRSGHRIALISEWDSFYSRALIESFKTQVARDARLGSDEKTIGMWSISGFCASAIYAAWTDASRKSPRATTRAPVPIPVKTKTPPNLISVHWRNPTATPSLTTCGASPTISPARTLPIDATAKAASARLAYWASMPTTSSWCCKR